MKTLGLLFVICVFLITGCAAEETTGIEKENPLKYDELKTVDQATEEPTVIEQGSPFKHYELRAVDQAAEVEGLTEFREDLITNIKARNIDFLDKYFDDEGKWDFDGTTKEQLLENWDEENWLELQQAVLLGGTFFDEEKTLFIAPYTFHSFPDEFDAYEFEAATTDHVEVYMDKDVDSTIIENLNYTIVKRINEEDEDPYWKKIVLPDGRVGYVVGDNVRSPIDYRVGLEKVNNDWKVTFFLDGD